MVGHPARHRRAGLAILVVALAVVGLLRFEPASTSPATTGGAGTVAEEQEREFGGEAILVSIEGPLGSTLSPNGISELIELEGRLSKLDGVANVVGPGGFINQSTIQADRLVTARLGPAARRASRAGDRARRSARRRGVSAAEAAAIGDRARVAALGADRSQFEQALSRLGGIGLPSIANPAYVNAIVFGRDNAPKPRFRWLFPDAQHAVILVRPRHGLSAGAVGRLGDEVRARVARIDVRGARLTVGGPSLSDADEAAGIPFELLRSLVIASIIGGLLFAGIFRVSARNIAAGVGVGLGCTAVGVLAASALVPRPGAGLLMAAPVIASVCVAMALRIRFLAHDPSVRETGAPPENAVLHPILPVGAGLLGIAVLAQLSGVGLLARATATTAIGVSVGLAATALITPFVTRGRLAPRPDDRLELRPWVATRRTALRRALGARSIGHRARLGLTAVAAVILVVGIGIAATSTVGLAQTAPDDAQNDEARQAKTVAEQTGVAQEVRIALRGDVTSPGSVVWLNGLGRSLRRIDRGVTVGPNIGELLSNGARPSQARIDALYEVTPTYLLRPMITSDRRTAQLRVAIPTREPAALRGIMSDITDAVRDTPDGLQATVTGRLADAARADDRLDARRVWILLGALLVIVGVAAAVFRDRSRAVAVAAPAFASAGAIGCALGVLGIDVTAQTTAALLLSMAFGLLLAVGAEPPPATTSRRDPLDGPDGPLGAVVVPLVFGVAAFVTWAASGSDGIGDFGLLMAVGVIASAATLAAVPTGGVFGGQRHGMGHDSANARRGRETHGARGNATAAEADERGRDDSADFVRSGAPR